MLRRDWLLKHAIAICARNDWGAFFKVALHLRDEGLQKIEDSDILGRLVQKAASY
jgi:hypothetical protein